MADVSDAIREGFVRQRRNLIGMSVILVLYEKLEIVIDSISILGNTARINDPSRVTLLLWIAWGYFLIRYYQYFRDTPDKGFSTSYHSRLHALARRVAQSKFRREFIPTEKFDDVKGPLDFRFGDITVWSAYPHYWDLEMNVDVSYRTETGVANHSLHGCKINLSWKDLAIPKVRSLLHVALNTRLVSEYLLPFFIAVVPVAYWIFTLVRK